MNESELLEQFLQALRRDRHAVPPAGLDPDLAEMARQMVEQAPKPTSDVRRRMWERALAQSRSASNGYVHKEQEIMTVITARPTEQKGARFSLTLLAAAVAVVLCIAALMLMPKGAPNMPSLGVVPGIEQNETATPIPVYTTTFTPTPNVIIVTATIVPPVVISVTPVPANIEASGDASIVLGTIYVPVIGAQAAANQASAENGGVLAQDVTLLYQVILEDGTVVYVDAQNKPEDMTFEVNIAQLFPGAVVIFTSAGEYEGEQVNILTLSNGLLVLTAADTQQIVAIVPDRTTGGTVPFDGLQPTVPPPADSQQLQPTILPVTETPLPSTPTMAMPLMATPTMTATVAASPTFTPVP